MKKSLVKAIALTAAMSLASVNLSFAAGGNIGHGDISIYKNGSVVSKLSGQNPIEDSALMQCDGKCLVKSAGISLLAFDQSRLAVANETDLFNLYVKEGSVNYIINNNDRKVVFYAPDGSYTVGEVVFGADSGSAVKGNVAVTSDGTTEISVSEGRMVFATADGMKAVDANKKIVLAISSTPATASWIPWVAGAAAVGLGIWGISELNDDDDPVVVPPVTTKPPAKKVTRRSTPVIEDSPSTPASPDK